MNNKGQSVISEYVMIFFVVIAAAVAMTVFVQRSFEARVHDARNFLINSANSACDANCLQATGGTSIPYEYEPYYQQSAAIAGKYENDAKGEWPGNAQVIGVIYKRSTNEQNNVVSTSNQLPPVCAGPPPYPCSATCGGVAGTDVCGNPCTGTGTCTTGTCNAAGQCISVSST